MKIDIVFPNKNEKKFIEIAEKLDFDGLCFIYKFQKLDSINKKLNELSKNTKLKLFTGLIADQRDINKAKKFSNLVLTKSTEKDQHILEKSPPDILFNMEAFAKRDPTHFRASGLNQILCKLASKNKVIIPIPLKIISDAENKPLIIGRIMQNIKLCKKYKVNQAICSFAEKPYQMKATNDLISLGISLGMDIPLAKKSLNFVFEKISENTKKKSPDYFGEGIELVK